MLTDHLLDVSKTLYLDTKDGENLYQYDNVSVLEVEAFIKLIRKYGFMDENENGTIKKRYLLYAVENYPTTVVIKLEEN